MSKDRELDDFLRKVDDLESVMSALNSTDDTVQREAMSKADHMIHTANEKRKANDSTGFSRTQINKIEDTAPRPPAQSDNHPDSQPDTMDMDAFKRVLESDASERAARRKERQKEADVHRIRGNAHFQNRDYELAYDQYTEALSKIKDDKTIYTNRAQALIKLSRYTEALSDCDWALRVDPNYVKALIHEGRAHLGMGSYDQARGSYHKAMEIDPKKSSLIEDYLAEVDRSQSASSSESVVQSLFEAGDSNITDIGTLLEKVCRPQELPVYYSGGFSVIAECIKNDNQRTIFRTKCGLELHSTHHVLSRCLEASPKSLSQEQLQMISSAMKMFTVACTDNETNQEKMFDPNTLPQNLLTFLESSIKGQGQVLKVNILTLLQAVSTSHIGRTQIITRFDISRLMVYVFDNIKQSKVAIKGMAVLNNLALHPKFKHILSDKFESTILPPFLQLLTDNSMTSLSVSPLCVTMVTNLSCDRVMCDKLASCGAMWDSVSQLLTRLKDALHDKLSSDITYSLLGLLINISKQSTPGLITHSPVICDACWDMYENELIHVETKERCLQLICALLLHSTLCVHRSVTRNGHLHLLHEIQDVSNEAKVTWCIKGLTACTQGDPKVCQHIVDSKAYKHITKLLATKNETIIANSALCLSHCTCVKEMCSSLVPTNIIMDLLVLARDGKNEIMQQNCSILVAKLCKWDKRHLDKLRELHGLEILHMAAKPYKM